MVLYKKFHVSKLEENKLGVVEKIKTFFPSAKAIYLYFLGKNEIGISDSIPLYLRRSHHNDFLEIQQSSFAYPIPIDEKEYQELLDEKMGRPAKLCDPFR